MPESIVKMLDVARSGILARLQDLDATSANLANSGTVGYQRTRSNFQETLNAANGFGGALARATQRLTDAGSLRQTGQPLDLAIEGEGFFAVRLLDGATAYTRDGHFQRDALGQIVNDSGEALIWSGQIPPQAEEVHINPDGTLMTRQGQVWTQAGRVQLSRFANPSGLLGHGENLWVPSAVSGQAITGDAATPGFGQLGTGMLENSNVSLADEMTHLLSVQRAYGLSVRAFQQVDQMLAQAIRMRQ